MSLISLYLDDSDGSRGTQKYCVWGGLILTEKEAISLQDKFDALKISNGLSKYDPVKWSPKDNKTEYGAQRKLVNQNEFRFSILNLIAESDLSLVAAVFESNKGLSKKDMQVQLMNDLAVRFQFELQERAKNTDPKCRGAIVLAYPGTSNVEISRNLYALHRGGGDFKSRNRYASESAKIVRLDKLEPAAYFSYEIHNPMLQLADVVCSCVSWTLKKREFHFFDKIKNKFRNRNGNIKGAGILVYPNNSTFVDDLCSRSASGDQGSKKVEDTDFEPI